MFVVASETQDVVGLRAIRFIDREHFERFCKFSGLIDRRRFRNYALNKARVTTQRTCTLIRLAAIRRWQQQGSAGFVKMDDGQVDGVFGNDGFIDGRQHTPEQVAGFIQERVEIARQR